MIVCGKRYEATKFLFDCVPSERRLACSATKPRPYESSVKYSFAEFNGGAAAIAPKDFAEPGAGAERLAPTVFVRISVVLAFCVCSNSSITRRFR